MELFLAPRSRLGRHQFFAAPAPSPFLYALAFEMGPYGVEPAAPATEKADLPKSKYTLTVGGNDTLEESRQFPTDARGSPRLSHSLDTDEKFGYLCSVVLVLQSKF
jgi:hypothetical protein